MLNTRLNPCRSDKWEEERLFLDGIFFPLPQFLCTCYFALNWDQSVWRIWSFQSIPITEIWSSIQKKSADPFRLALSSQHSTLSQLCLPARWLLYMALHMHGLWEPRCTNKRNKNQYVADTGGIMVGCTFGAAVSSLVCSEIFLMLCSNKKGLIFKIYVPFLFHFPERHAIISAVIPEAFRKMDMHWVLCWPHSLKKKKNKFLYSILLSQHCW